MGFILPTNKSSDKEYDIIVIGAGPAGLTAGIYGGRAGLNILILEKGIGGGLVNEAPLIENYSGFESINGMDLSKNMKDHAEKYANIFENENVIEIRKDDKFHVVTENGEYVSKALILATGTTHKKLNLPGEKEYFKRGLSYCSTCDGYFFKDKDVVVIGGANSGAIAAISLSKICKKVTILEYMDKIMCEKFYENKIMELGIDYLGGMEVQEILGDGNKVTRVKYKDRDSGEVKEINCDGTFIYAGLEPINQLAKDLDIELNEKGYIVVDKGQRTSMKGVYSAGDITGNVAQIIVAASEGAISALTAFKDLQ